MFEIAFQFKFIIYCIMGRVLKYHWKLLMNCSIWEINISVIKCKVKYKVAAICMFPYLACWIWRNECLCFIFKFWVSKTIKLSCIQAVFFNVKFNQTTFSPLLCFCVDFCNLLIVTGAVPSNNCGWICSDLKN